MLQDLRFAFRQLAKSPGFTAVAVLTLGIGIAVNAVFTTIANDLFFRPLPAVEPERLVVIATAAPFIPYQFPLSYADAADFRAFVEGTGAAAPDMARVFAGLMAYKEQVVHLSQTGKSTERAWVHAATDNYFSVLGAQPHLGRFFQPQEAASPGGEPVVVLTHDAWRNQFGGDPGIVGQIVKLNGLPFTVIGVTRPGFVGASWGTALSGFVPATMLTKLLPGGEHWALKRGNTSVFLMGRLRPGVEMAQARAACDVAYARVMQDNPGQYAPQSRLAVMRENHSRPSPFVAQHTPKIIVVLSALGLLVLVVALANTAGLLYARGTTRERELAIRAAVGATRFQIVRQLLVESLLLATLAGALGLLLAQWAGPGLLALLPTPANTAPPTAVSADWRPFVVTAIVALVAGFLAGILPALRASGIEPLTFLRPSASGIALGRHRLRRWLIVSQVAVSTIVLAGAALALRSALLLARADLGYRSENLHLVSFDLGAQRYSEANGRQFQANLIAAARVLPGVESVSLTTGAPLDAGIGMLGGIRAAEESAPAGVEPPSVPTISVEHDYLRVVGLTLMAGREFTARDDAAAPAVAIVNAALARTLWPGRDAVGQRINIQGKIAEVIGIVGNSRYYGIQEVHRPLLIVPLAQRYRGEATLVVRVEAFAPSPLPAITDLVRRFDADLPLFNPRTMREQIERSPSGLMPFRMGAILAGFQGGIVLLLAGAGIFGLVAFNVTRRTREIGIRLALGAPRAAVVRDVTRESAVLTLIGLGAGLAVAGGMARLLSALLYGSGASDVLLLGGVAIVVVATVAIACWLPARRATRVDPMEALRAE